MATPNVFHDDYFSLLVQTDVGVTGKSWADEFFVSASYSKTDKELQTGSVQTKVYGMAERNSDAWNISARYGWRDRLQLATNISYQDARNRQKYKEDEKPSATYNNHVPNRPWLFGSAEASYKLRDVALPGSKLRLECPLQWVHWYFLAWEAYGNRDTKARIPSQLICNTTITYSWKKDLLSPVDSQMVGSAYGQLLQDCVMYDEAGNLYLACFTKEDSVEKGMLLRVKAGEYTFDPSYNGYKDSDGKLITVQYLSGNKALVYTRKNTLGTKSHSYSHYYSIIGLKTGTKEHLSYNNEEIAYSTGRFTQRSVLFNHKAYIGVNTQADTNAIVYIYDLRTGKVEKGAEVGGEYYFDMMRVIEN